MEVLSCYMRLKIINVRKTFPKSKPSVATGLSLMLYIVSLCLIPCCLQAAEIASTVDTKTIHYPSMFVGQVWVRSGEPSSQPKDGGEGRIVTGREENSSSNLKTDHDSTAVKGDKKSPSAVTQVSSDIKKESAPDSEAIKKLKEKRLKNLQAQEKRKAKTTSSDGTSLPVAGKEEENNPEGKIKKTASNRAFSAQAAGKEKAQEKTSEGKAAQLKMLASVRTTDAAISNMGSPGKKWHHKQDLYNVECGQRLARVVSTYYFDQNGSLVSSKIHSDDQWYHIYPGSVEEKIFIEVCHPTIPTVRRY